MGRPFFVCTEVELFFFQQKEERNQLWFEAIFLTDSEYNEDSALLFIF